MGAKVSSGGTSKRGSYATNGDMNIIPFIDILLVLLIIFMVAAPLPTADVKVDLPPPVPPPEQPEQPKRPTIVSIRDYGDGTPQIWIDNLVLVDDMSLGRGSGPGRHQCSRFTQPSAGIHPGSRRPDLALRRGDGGDEPVAGSAVPESLLGGRRRAARRRSAVRGTWVSIVFSS
jgi:hypothetical protein